MASAVQTPGSHQQEHLLYQQPSKTHKALVAELVPVPPFWSVQLPSSTCLLALQQACATSGHVLLSTQSAVHPLSISICSKFQLDCCALCRTAKNLADHHPGLRPTEQRWIPPATLETDPEWHSASYSDAWDTCMPASQLGSLLSIITWLCQRGTTVVTTVAGPTVQPAGWTALPWPSHHRPSVM